MFFPSFNMMPSEPFNCEYCCYSTTVMLENRPDVDTGGKIILPPSALEHLTRLNIDYPMFFRLTSQTRSTHCGVLEFTAAEGTCYMPYWMLQNLLLDEGSTVTVEYVTLPVATFVRFQPQTSNFLDIYDHKAVLENSLRNFSCLTEGDVISIRYNDRDYQLSVLEVQPNNAVSIIECDMIVDFAPPLDAAAKEADQMETEEEEKEEDAQKMHRFPGEGIRLDGRIKENNSSKKELKSTEANLVYGRPNYDYKIGTLKFIRDAARPSNQAKARSSESKAAFSPFSGFGHSLKEKR